MIIKETEEIKEAITRMLAAHNDLFSHQEIAVVNDLIYQTGRLDRIIEKRLEQKAEKAKEAARKSA